MLKKSDLANLKSDVDIDKLKNVPSNLRSFESKVDHLDADKLVPVPVDWSKLSDVVKMSLKKMYIILRSKILKIKYLILLIQLLILLLMVNQMKLKTKYLALLT